MIAEPHILERDRWRVCPLAPFATDTPGDGRDRIRPCRSAAAQRTQCPSPDHARRQPRIRRKPGPSPEQRGANRQPQAPWLKLAEPGMLSGQGAAVHGAGPASFGIAASKLLV